MEFNTGEVINSPPNEFILKIALLLAWEVEINISSYQDRTYKNYNVSNNSVRSSLFSLFNHLKPWLRNDLSIEEFTLLKNSVESKNTQELFIAYDYVNEWLFNKKVTDVFKKKVIL
jgi:hypothetical protein